MATSLPAEVFDLSITARANTNMVHLGDTITYTLCVSNQSAQAVSGAVLINWVDPSCRVVTLATGCEYQNVINNQVAAMLPTLPAHGFWNSTIIVRPTLGGQVVNMALVTKHVADADPENDTVMTFTSVAGGVLLQAVPGPGGMGITVSRTVGKGCVVEASTDLQTWAPVLTNFGLPSFTFTVAPGAAKGFYRVREQ
jgi:uncharacterized repeat protein (TIGR01451 family)